MNIPFPILTPRLLDSKWFGADVPCDEEAELAALEQSNQHWFKQLSLQLSSVGQPFKSRTPLGKVDQEHMEECESEEEEGNDESDESEETHDEDEEEELRQTYTPTRNNNDVESEDTPDLNELVERIISEDPTGIWPESNTI